MEELRGLLAVGVLPEILRRIFLAQRSGVLHLAFGVERSDFEFSDGYLTQVVTTLPGAHLGDLLVQIGFLGKRDRDACLEIAALANERLGETLLRHGLLDSEHLAQGLAFQLREVLARTLVWRGGVYTFTDAPREKSAAPSGAAPMRLDPREILLDATWTLASDPVLDDFLGDLTQTLRKTSDERLLRLDFRLTPADAFLLSRVDGNLTAEQLLQLSPVSAEEVKASLAGLLSVGAIEYVDAPLASSKTEEIGRFEVARLAGRIESADPFEILGVTSDASADQVRSAYLRLLRACDPSASGDSELKPILQRMSNQLAEAFMGIERRRGTPRPALLTRHAARTAASLPPPTPGPSTPAKPALSPMSRVAPSPKPADRNAPVVVVQVPAKEPASLAPIADPSQAIEASAQAFDAGHFHEALAILHAAIPRLEGRARRAARVRKARVLLAVENGAKLAEEELKAAIVEDAGNAEAHVVLGGIYRERGSQALAMMEYRKALDLEPRNTAARDALEELRTGSTPKPPEASARKKLSGR